METRDHENSTLAFLPEENTFSVLQKDELRERVKIEFYKTYDVMTGIRIAATLGGFFSMMILLVLYKNYCKPSKSLSEEQLNAAVTAAAEEEDRALQAALEATSFYKALDKRRQSMGNASQILMTPRFSSVGGGYSHLTPPLKSIFVQQRGKSLPGSILQFGSNGNSVFLHRDDRSPYYYLEEDMERCPADVADPKNHPNIASNRRVSSVTCFSADSAYLERRCSALEMGLDEPYFSWRQSREKLTERKNDFGNSYYPIDIQVTQPTPEMSPTPSERNLNESSHICGLQVPGIHEQIYNLSVKNLERGFAPLASISSLGDYSQTSLSASKSLRSTSTNPSDYQGIGSQDSTGSDSVFMDAEELTTDSEFEYDEFNDDYSFCETRQVKTPTLRSTSQDGYLRSASFDSCDESRKCETVEKENQKQFTKKYQCSFATREKPSLIRRRSLNDQNRTIRKLRKVNSEPRNGKVPKILPPWTEMGKSKYVPFVLPKSLYKKRFGIDHATGSKRWTESEVRASGSEETMKKDEKIKVPLEKHIISDSAIVFQNFSKSGSMPSSPRIGTIVTNDSPPLTHHKNTHKQLSLPTVREKRSRFQKQKNFMEDIKPTTDESIEGKTKEAERMTNEVPSGTNR